MKESKIRVERTKKLVEYDRQILSGAGLFCGIDEAGRGPLAGPVVVASCVMPLDDDKIIFGIDDSKKLSAQQRDELFEKIKQTAIEYSIQQIDEQTIDNINILQATKLGMKQCIDALPKKPNLALIDAVKDVDSDIDQIAIIKGDATSYSIASASILAKVYRDSIMYELDKKYPFYDYKKNKGYPTKEHVEALYKYGKTKLYRQTFKPVYLIDKEIEDEV